MSSSLGVKVAVLMLVLLISGCVSSRKVSLPPPSVVDRTAQSKNLPAQLTDKNIQRILTLLGEADQAMADKRLTTPEHFNAWSFYRRVLKLQPENEEARQGFDRIVERYIAWSQGALQQGKVSTASHYLQRATLVNPDHPALA
ncbi:MAG: hypothetical protein V7677_01245, partial [Motiliproteus sp.]